MERLLDIKTASEQWGVSRWTLLRWCRLGKVPSVRRGKRVLRVRECDLQAIIEAHLHHAREASR